MKGLLIIILSLLFSEIYSQNIFDFVKTNNLEAVESYADSVNIRDDKRATPLMWAVFKSDLKMVKLLISKGANPNLKGWITFHDTISGIEFMYGSCLVIAAGENKMDILKYLLEKQKISVEDKEYNLFQDTENGWNALQWASANGNIEIIKYLIKKGANINSEAETDNNQTPLLLSLRLNQKKATRLLVKLGANVNKTDSWGETPLMYALSWEDKKLIKYLYKKGARFNEKDKVKMENRLFDVFKVKNMEKL